MTVIFIFHLTYVVYMHTLHMGACTEWILYIVHTVRVIQYIYRDSDYTYSLRHLYEIVTKGSVDCALGISAGKVTSLATADQFLCQLL